MFQAYEFVKFGEPSRSFIPEKSAEPEVVEEYKPAGHKQTVMRRKYLPGEKLLKNLNKTAHHKQVSAKKNKYVEKAIDAILADLAL